MKTNKIIKSRHDLQVLIRTLSKQEKRYFRLFSALQKGEKHYLQLFDLMNEQPEIEEKTLKDKLNIPHFHTVKSYLFDHLLESLIQYEQDHHPYLRLRKEYIAAVVLCERLLFEAALIKINKLYTEAEKIEDFSVMYDCCQLRKVILRALHADNDIEVWTIPIQEETTLLLKMRECFEANLRLKYAYFDGYLQRNVVLMKQNIAEHSANEMPEFLSKRAIYYHCTAMSFYHIALGQYYEAYLFQKKMYDMFTNNKTFAHKNYISYSECLLNYGYILLAFREYETMKEVLDEQLDLSEKLAYQSDLFRYRHQARTLIMILGYMIESQKVKVNMAFLLQRWNELVPNFHHLLAHHQIFIINKFAIIYLLQDQPNQSLKMLNYLEMNEKNEVFQRFTMITNIIRMITHYELNDRYLLQSMVRSSRRKKQIAALEQIFLDLFYGLTLRKPNTKVFEIALQELNTFYEKNNLNIEHHPRFFWAWLQSKKLDKNIMEVMENG